MINENIGRCAEKQYKIHSPSSFCRLLGEENARECFVIIAYCERTYNFAHQSTVHRVLWIRSFRRIQANNAIWKRQKMITLDSLFLSTSKQSSGKPLFISPPSFLSTWTQILFTKSFWISNFFLLFKLNIQKNYIKRGLRRPVILNYLGGGWLIRRYFMSNRQTVETVQGLPDVLFEFFFLFFSNQKYNYGSLHKYAVMYFCIWFEYRARCLQQIGIFNWRVL